MRSLQPRPGDIHIVLNDGTGSIAYLLPKDKVTDLERQRMKKLITVFRTLFIEGRTVVNEGIEP